MSRRRFLAPYLAIAAVIAIVAGLLTGNDSVTAPAIYGIGFLALLVGLVGAVRWEERDIRSGRR